MVTVIDAFALLAAEHAHRPACDHRSCGRPPRPRTLAAATGLTKRHARRSSSLVSQPGTVS